MSDQQEQVEAIDQIEKFYHVYSGISKNINNATQFHNQLLEYLKAFPDSVYENVWWDAVTKSFVSGGQTLENPLSGINHHFITNQSNFLNTEFPRNSSFIQSHYDVLLKQCDGQEIKNTEIRLSLNASIEKMLEQDEVLIIGGGPSTNAVDFEDFKDTPKWTMNNFFLHKAIKNLDNIQLITLLDNVDIENPLLWECVSRINPLILQEISDMGYQRIKKIKTHHENMTCMLTRYRSRLGVGPRLIVLAIMLGIKNIYFCGFDGFDVDSKNTHSFEKSKDFPQWFKTGGKSLQRQQFFVFWTYILELQKFYNFRLHDLTKGVESVQYKFIQGHLK
jgi:hypothetical protein